jgi:hypothetical protein
MSATANSDQCSLSRCRRALIVSCERVPINTLANLELASKTGALERKKCVMKLAIGLVSFTLAVAPIAVAPTAIGGCDPQMAPIAGNISAITGATDPCVGGAAPAASPPAPPPAAPPAPAPLPAIPAAPPPAAPAPPAPVVAPPAPAGPAPNGISPGHGEPSYCGTPEQPPGTDSLCPVTALTPFN